MSAHGHSLRGISAPGATATGTTVTGTGTVRTIHGITAAGTMIHGSIRGMTPGMEAHGGIMTPGTTEAITITTQDTGTPSMMPITVMWHAAGSRVSDAAV